MMEWDDQMYLDADAIAVVGASNPYGVLNTLREMTQTARAEGLDMTAVREHPAIQATVGHLAFLFGQSFGPSMESLSAVIARVQNIRERQEVS